MDKQRKRKREDELTTPARAIQAPEENTWGRLAGFAVLVVASVLVLNRIIGPENLWTGVKVLLGLSFLIFIHELGHFLVAKWCDVHVEAFSIGFGPSLPGCSFQRGETTYKIGALPLGGYVKMVGEGPESDEDDVDPRSFKNKSVGQRMAIISAGVIMNLITGCIFFIVAYRVGVEQPAADVGVVDPGSPAWQKGIPSGAVFKQIGDIQDPYFSDLKPAVMLSKAGESIRFVYQSPGQAAKEVSIEPRLEKTDKSPAIGYTPVNDLELPLRRDLREEKYHAPVFANSAAAAARVLNLEPGDQVLATTDPDNSQALQDLPPVAGLGWNHAEFGKRLQRLAGHPMSIQVRSQNGAIKEFELPLTGFEFGDAIVGSTEAGPENDPYDPFRVTPLPVNPRDPQGKHLDYFEFMKRLQILADKTIVIQVRRRDASGQESLASVVVPPAYHLTLRGAHMEMGAVAALRDGSPARKMDVRPGDTITMVKLTDEKDESVYFGNTRGKNLPAAAVVHPLSPLRLPDQLRQWAKGRSRVQAALTVSRANLENHKASDTVDLQPGEWQDRWQFDQEEPLRNASPMAIPELGIAYYVKTTVEKVDAHSSAAKAGIQPGDVILEVSFKKPTDESGKDSGWQKPIPLWTKQEADEQHPEPWWAYIQRFFDEYASENPEVQLKVRRIDKEKNTAKEETITAGLQPDDSWPLHDPFAPRGLLLFGKETRLQQATSFSQAVALGVRYTHQSITQVYEGLRSMLAQRLSPSDNLQGPLGIAMTSFLVAGRDWSKFILFLGMISVNLAVINFLPIPVLDGGHMIFLLYEKIRGKPASDQVRATATYVGVILLLSLMIFAVYLDVKRIWF